MIAIDTKKLLQIIIGPGKIRDAIAVPQAGPGAPADLQTVPNRGRAGPGLGVMRPHGPTQPVQPALHGCLRARGVVVQDVGGAMHPAIGHTPLGPPRRRRVQPTPQDRLQAPEGCGPAPLFSTRSRLGALALRRAWSGSPAADKGRRPSSVRARRTAPPSPRMP